MLSKICESPNADDWDEQLPFVQAAYNGTLHAVTGQQPFKLLFGREFNEPSSCILDAAPSPYLDD